MLLRLRKKGVEDAPERVDAVEGRRRGVSGGPRETGRMVVEVERLGMLPGISDAPSETGAFGFGQTVAHA